MTEYGLKDSISTITGKPQPAFDEKVKVAKGVGQGLKEYAKGLYYNINPSAGPETVYESILAPKAIKETALSARAMWKDAKTAKSLLELLRPKLPKADVKYIDNAYKVSKARGIQAEQEVVKYHVQDVMRNHAIDIANTPQVMLDPIKHMKHFGPEDSYIKSALGAFGDRTKNIYLNPIKHSNDVVAHEATHGLQDYWSNPKRLLGHKTGTKPLSKAELERVHRTRYLDATSEQFKGKPEYFDYYNQIPSEVNAQRMAEGVIKGQKKLNRVLTDEEAMGMWDRGSERQARRLKNVNFMFHDIGKRDVQFLEKKYPELKAFKLEGGFKNTQEAVDYGTKAKPHQINKLTKYYKKSLAKQEQFKTNKDYQSWMDEATRGQFYREALDASLGKHPLQKGGKR